MSDKRVEAVSKVLAYHFGRGGAVAPDPRAYEPEAAWVLEAADAADDCVRVPHTLFLEVYTALLQAGEEELAGRLIRPDEEEEDV